MTIYRAKEPFAYTDTGGVPRQVRAGDLFDQTDACLKGRQHLFELVEVAAARRVEDASAPPGEPRSVSTVKHPSRKPSAKPSDG